MSYNEPMTDIMDDNEQQGSAINMWSSKDEVLRDLANVNGVYANVDDHLVQGFRPPPPTKIHEDIADEFNLRFGEYGDQIAKSNYDPDCQPGFGPDCQLGIHKMLRLANIKPQGAFRPRDNSQADPQVIVISKLNPDVEEFVPKPKTKQRLENGDNKATNGELNVKLKDRQQNTNDEQERQKMAALLKSKISTALKEDSYEKKREKNVAIAALLRLNSAPPKAPPNSSSEPPKETTEPPKETTEVPKETTEPPKQPLILFTPDYFAGPSRVPKEIIVDDSEHAIPEPKPLLETPVKPLSPHEAHDPIIKESIEKVNNWLNSPDKKPKPKAPVPYIGPVTFKKKESITPKSPCSEVSKKTEQYVIPKFIPSQNAAQLAKDFEAQVKAKEETEKPQPPVDLWTRLEVQLKKRDEEIKKRSREQLGSQSGSVSNKSSGSSSSRRN